MLFCFKFTAAVFMRGFTARLLIYLCYATLLRRSSHDLLLYVAGDLASSPGTPYLCTSI